MLHHSNSRHQRNRGSKVKTLLKVTLLLGVAVWLVYQVKHSYDKKNEYLNATENQLSHDDRSMFQGRKERVGSYGVGDVDKAVEDIDVISNKDEEKSGETVFEKDTESHDDDAGNTERSEAEEDQASRVDGNAEAHGKDEDETTGRSEALKLDAESNSSDGESKSEVRSIEDDVPRNKDGQEGTAGEVNGTPHEEKEQSDGSSNSDQINASSNHGEKAEKKEEVESQADSGSLSDDTKAGTGDEHSAETLPDETGNIPAVHTENPQNGASENLGDSSSEAVHIEIGSEHEGAKASSGTASGDAEKGNAVESNPSDSIFVEEKTETASGGDEKGAESGTAHEVSGVKEANPEEGNATTEAHTDQAANTQTENPQDASASERANGSLEENQVDGATKASSNSDQEDIKIETNTSTNDEHSENQSVNVSSGSSGSSDSGPEQTGKPETQ